MTLMKTITVWAINRQSLYCTRFLYYFYFSLTKCFISEIFFPFFHILNLFSDIFGIIKLTAQGKKILCNLGFYFIFCLYELPVYTCKWREKNTLFRPISNRNNISLIQLLFNDRQFEASQTYSENDGLRSNHFIYHRMKKLFWIVRPKMFTQYCDPLFEIEKIVTLSLIHDNFSVFQTFLTMWLKVFPLKKSLDADEICKLDCQDVLKVSLFISSLFEDCTFFFGVLISYCICHSVMLLGCTCKALSPPQWIVKKTLIERRNICWIIILIISK